MVTFHTFGITDMSNAKPCIHRWLTVLRTCQQELQDLYLSFPEMNGRFCERLSCTTHFVWTLG